MQGAGSLLSARESCNAACQWVGSPGGRESDLSGNSPRRNWHWEPGSSLRAVTPVVWTGTGSELAGRSVQPGACQWHSTGRDGRGF